MHGLLARLQPLGRALMLPIAVLPLAALLLRLGQPDMLALGFVADAGGAIFGNLGLVFAIGVAVGLARENHGAAGLAGVVCYLVAVESAKSLLPVPPDLAADAAAAWKTKEMGRLSVPVGILSGLAAGALYNRYAAIRLPEALSFFGGRRFVPIAAGLAGLAGGALVGWAFPVLADGIDALSRSVLGAGSVGLFLYGALNRLLLVTGLHHILNNLAWFILGEYGGKTGDLNRFFAGDPTAGAFMAGYFPIMMFGLPAACLAMYHAAAPERRRAVGGLFLSLGLTSFLTGVTEPIEFTFMFLAPLLYALHAVLTGIGMVVMDALGVQLGFGFSAGLFDYLLNFGLATRPLLLLPVGLAYAAIYYGTFRWCIARFDLKTPGREAAAEPSAPPVAPGGTRAEALIAALGGAGNLLSVDACTTRLRLTLARPDAADEAALRVLGARGVVRPGGDALQVVLGPTADAVAGEMREALRSAAPLGDAAVAALGGATNIARTERVAGRLRVTLRFAEAIDAAALTRAVPRGWMRVADDVLHLLA